MGFFNKGFIFYQLARLKFLIPPTLVILLVLSSLLQTQGKDWLLFLPISVVGQEEVKIFYDEELEISLDMLTIDYDGNPRDLILEVLPGTGYDHSGNTIFRTIVHNQDWNAAGEEILVNIRVSDGTGELDNYELKVLVIPPMTQTRYEEKPCMAIITLEVKAYQPNPGITSKSFPVNFSLLDLEGNIIQEQNFTNSFPGQGTASAEFDFEELNLSRLDTYDVIVKDNLGRVFSKRIGPLGEPYSINFDINVSGPLCAEDQGGVVEYIIFNAEVPLTSFIIYDEENNIVSDTYELISITNDYLVINSKNIGSGSFRMEVIDGLGCTGTEDFKIILPEPITVEESIQNLSCFGTNNGEIVLSITGGWSQTFDGNPIEAARNYSVQWFTLSGEKIGTGTSLPIEEGSEIMGMKNTLSGLKEGSYYA